jgi:hypothetical protein
MMHRLHLLTLILLALLLPFELDSPWFRLGPLVLTNVEVVLWSVLAVAAARWWQAGRPRPPVPALWAALGVLFLAAIAFSALLAPDFRLNAFKAFTRTALGMTLVLAVSLGVRGPRDLRWVAGALVTGGLMAAVVGLAEMLDGAGFSWLRPLRSTPTVVGPFMRLSGPFDYANQAAMFFEATLPLLVAFGWMAWRRRRWRLIPALLAILLCAQATILTFSRTSFMTLLLVNVGLALLLVLPAQFHKRLFPSSRHRQLAVLAGSVAFFIIALVGANSLLSPVFRLRFISESDRDWYLVHLDVPAQLDLVGGQQETVPVTVTNEGILTWQPAGDGPVQLAARWIQLASGRELSERPRWPLPGPVAPGETLTLEVPVRAPQTAGRYRLVWDMVQEQVVWFGAKTGQETASLIDVAPAATSERLRSDTREEAGDAFETSWVYEAPIPGRLTLWRAAAQMWQERPFLGVGLDNFRLLYGRSLGYKSWNTSIHSNNWYVETVVSAGLLGSVPFLLWLGLILLDVGRQLRRPRVDIWQWALAAGLLAFLVHGLLDYFLLFNATGLLFWMLVGLWLSATRSPVWQENPG